MICLIQYVSSTNIFRRATVTNDELQQTGQETELGSPSTTYESMQASYSQEYENSYQVINRM